jgi:hypothetical protein
MCNQLSEKHVKTNTVKAAKNRCHSAVTAIPLQSQQSRQKMQPAIASAPQIVIATKRRHRPSSTSATMRIPHELRAQVAAIVAKYRERHRNDPDCW